MNWKDRVEMKACESQAKIAKEKDLITNATIAVGAELKVTPSSKKVKQEPEPEPTEAA